MPKPILSATLLLLLATSAFSQDDIISQLEELLPAIGRGKIEARQSAQQEWSKLCNSVPKAADQKRTSICKAMSEMLSRDRTKPNARIFILRQLERLGREESVDTLATLLESENRGVHEAARRALANNPSPKAGVALAARFAKVEKLQEQRALINAIGFRQDEQSVELLSKIASEKKGPLMMAAVSALSNSVSTGGSGAKLLRKGIDKDALLRLADRIAADGKKKAALAIYRPIAKNQTNTGFGAAAYRGLLEHDSQNVAELLQEGLTGTKIRRQVATGFLRNMPDEVAKQLLGQFNRLSDEAKVAMLTGLGSRSDQSFVESVTKAADSENRNIRIAAIDALGQLNAIAPLLAKLDSADKQTADAARTAIARMRGGSADAELIRLTKATTDSAKRATLLDLLNNRRVLDALPLFTASLSNTNETVRQKAFGALSRLGGADQVGDLLAAIMKLPGKERDRGEKQVVNMCRRLPDGAKSVVDYYESSSTDAKLELLPLLGRIGGETSLSTIRTGLASKNQKMVDASITAMSNWPDSSVSEDLKRVAEQSQSSGQKIRVLRALARVGVLGGNDQSKLAYLKFVMENATRKDEKILALDRAKAVRTLESLQFVLPHVTDSELGPRARRTVVDLAHHRGLREENRKSFEPALERVIPLLEDQRQVERAKKYLANE